MVCNQTPSFQRMASKRAWVTVGRNDVLRIILWRVGSIML